MVTVGRIVFIYPGTHSDPDLRANGNPGPVPAIVTRVWANECINVTAFPDSIADVSGIVRLNSVFQRTPSEAEMDAVLPNATWDWPPRA